MAIQITPEQTAELRAQGEAAFPDECCGFLLGASRLDGKTIHALRRARNVREPSARGRRYLIDPREFLEIEAEARSLGMDVIGIYHSHPNEPACPSAYDLEHAWPWYSYLILSVVDRRADALRSWVLREDRSSFDEEPIHVQPQGAPSCP